MLTEPVEAPGETTPEALLSRYEEHLRSVVEALGARHVAEADDVAGATVDAIERGDAADLDLRDVAAVLSLRDGSPDADALLSAVRDHLLLEMSAGMLTVDRLAAEVAGDVEPRVVQGKVEGRLPMTLAEYARLHHAVARAK